MAYPKTYKTDKGVYEIPEKEVSSFLKDFPNAMEVVSYKMGKDTFDIPVQETEVFLKENPQAVPLKKKEPSGNGLQEPSDGGLGGTTPKTETFPTIEMYQTPTGDLTEDPFAQVKKSKELLGKTKVVSKGGIGGMGMGTTGTEIVPDEEATKEAKKIQEELKRTGYKEDFFAGISDLPEDAYNNPATSKETLSVLYKNNPVKFTQLTNEAKNKYAIRDAAAKKAYDEAQGDDKQKTEYASRVGILKGNEYSGDEIAPPENMQQFYDIVKQKQQLIDQNIDSPEEKKKAQERLRQTYAQAINPTSLDFREEYQNSGLADKLDVNQYAGLKTLELFEPEKAKVLRSMVEANITPQWNVNVQVTPEEQVRSIVTDSAMAEKMGGVISELTTNQRIAKEEALRELSLVGATNEYDSIVSEQNDLKNKYKEAQTDEEKANIYSKMLLNEQRANDLQKTEAKNDERYPITAKLKMDNLVKEIVQDRGIGVGGWMYNKYAHGVGSGVDAVENLVTSIFGSEKEKTDLRMKRIGEGKQFEASIYLPESERSVNSPVIIQASDELKKKAKEILNGRSLSELSPDEKDKLSQLVASNQDQIKTITNPEAGKSKNFWSKATGMTIAGFTADMGSFLTKMGLMQGVGMGAKAAEATTLFMDGYEPAFNKKLAEGASVESANEYGILHGAVLSLMSKFGSKYETIKNVVKGGSSPISKYIAGLSEESWNKLAAESKPLLSKVGTAVKDVVKEQGKMVGTFGIAAPVASAVADNLFYNEGRSVKEISDEALMSAKEMAIGGIGFGLFGIAKGVMKTKATPVEKAALFEMADFPELGKTRIDEAVKNREISKEEGERKKSIIDSVSRLVEQVPEVNDKGKPLNDQQRANYLFNLAVKESQKEKAKNLPEKQAEEAKQKALVADKENQIELEALTEKQLNDRKDKLEKAISKLDEKGKPELSDKEMADAKAELEAVNNIIKSKGDTTKTEEKLPKLSEPIEGVDEFGVPIGENVPPEVKGEPEQITQPIELSVEPSGEVKPLTKEAEDLLASIGEGSKPTFITKNLERIAKENGIEVTDKMSADDVINALKEKQSQPTETKDTAPTPQTGKGEGDWSRDVESTAKALDSANGKELELLALKQSIKQLPDKDFEDAEANKNWKELQERRKAIVKDDNYLREQISNVENKKKADQVVFETLHNLPIEKSKFISEAYHKAKADGSNPELVKAVENLLGKPKETKIPNEPITEPVEDWSKDVESTAKALEIESKNKPTIWEQVKQFIKDTAKKVGNKLGIISNEQHLSNFEKAKADWDKLSSREKKLKRADYELDDLHHTEGGYYKVGDSLIDLDLNASHLKLLLENNKFLNILNKLGVNKIHGENRPPEEMFAHYSDNKIHLNNNSAFENIRQVTNAMSHELGHHEWTKLTKEERNYVRSLPLETGMAKHYEAQEKNGGKQTSASLQEENFADYVMQYFQGKLYGDEALLNKIPTKLREMFDNKYSDLLKDNEHSEVAEAYHKAKADGSNPELVKAVEDLLSDKSNPKVTEIESKKADIERRRQEELNRKANTPEGFTNRLFESNIQLGEFNNQGHLSEEGYNYRVLSQVEIDAILESGGVYAREGKQKGGNTNTKYWTKGNNKNWYGDKTGLETIRVKSENFKENEVVSAKDIEVYNKETGKFESLIDKINAKYDAELAELEKQQPPQGKGEGDWSRDVENVDLSKVDWKNPTTEESIAGHENHINNNVKKGQQSLLPQIRELAKKYNLTKEQYLKVLPSIRQVLSNAEPNINSIENIISRESGKSQPTLQTGKGDGGVKKQIEVFGVPNKDVEPVHNVITQVFDGLKKAGLTAAKTVGEWVGIGKGEAKPYTLKINGEEKTVKPVNSEVVNGFYSPLEKTINETKFDKLPAKQWIEKFARGEEAKWTGLNEWLSQQQGSVSKADIQKFLKENRIEVVEVVKNSENIGAIWNDKYEAWETTVDGKPIGDFADTKDEAIRYGKANFGDATKFGNYQLAGEKENYKEVLVTLPEKRISTDRYGIEKNPNGEYHIVDLDEGGSKSEFTLPREEAQKRIDRSNELWRNRADKKNPPFRSSHFDEPNILVHLRMNTRTDADGKKVLFLEEIQSDWGQKGKKEGFNITAKKNEFRKEKQGDGSWVVKDANNTAWWHGSTEERADDVINEYNTRETRIPKEVGAIPNAPFVTDTNAWTKLGLKVALKEAVSQGVDKIAWTTGEQQNDRYDLSKQVDAIEVSKDDTGMYKILAKKDGETTATKFAEKPQEIEAFIGKDMADKIVSANIPNGGAKVFSGVDLKVGGKGMIGFYGNPKEGKPGIVGQVAKSLFKQDPKTVEIESTNKTIKDYELDGIGDGFRMYEKSDYGTLKEIGVFKTREDAQNWINKNNTSTQHSIDITPEMRKQVESDGQPLFKEAEAQYRIESGKNIIEAIKDFDGSPRATVALTHEIMHPTVVSIIDGVKEGNEVGAKHTKTIIDEYNKATGKNITQEQLIEGNDKFKEGTTTKEYRAVQEFIAKAWERYHREGGKGFSEGFQKVLEQITQAFKAVYKSLTGKELTPELRKMFDDILGKEAEQILQTGKVETKIPNEPITEPVTKPIPEVTEPTKEQGIKEAVPEGTTKTGRAEPEGTAAVLEGERKKGITHSAIEEFRKIIGEPEYEGRPTEPHEQLIKEAQETISKDKSAALKVIEKMESQGEVSNKDNAIAAVYKATLDAEIERNPTKELLKQATRLAKALDVSGTKLGKALESRKLIGEEDNLANFLMQKEAAQGTELTENQIKEQSAKYNELKEAKEALEKQLEAEREQHKKDIAELGLNKAKAKARREAKKTDAEYKAERKSAVEAAREALKQIRENPQASAAPLFRELVAIAPHVKEYLNSLASQGIDKLDNIISEIHAEFKDVLEGLTTKNVLDILAGKYDEKKTGLTKNETAATIRLLQREAKLIKELADAKKGLEKAKTDQKVIESNRRIDELKKKIEEVKRLNKEGTEKEPVEDLTAGSNEDVAKYEEKLLRKIDKLNKDLKEGNYLKEPEKEPIFKKTRKAQILEDRVIDLENKIRHERSKDEYNKRSKLRKGFDKVMEVLGVRRLVQSALDISVPFRQGATMLSPRKIDVWAKGFRANLQSIFNPKKFERIMHEIRNDPMYHEMKKDNVVFNDMGSADPNLHNEDFRKSFIYKIPILSEPLKASNRSADAFLNVARYEMYKKLRANLERKGFTREADPKAFKYIGNWVMSMTGRGKMHSALEKPAMNAVLGNTFYGARLMASRLNLLNPVTYFDPRIPKEVRYEAMKDMAAFTSTMMTVATALAYTTGAKVSLNPDDSDFLQLRYGNKVYDISGGLANYVRTGLRIMKAGYTKATGTKYEGRESTKKAGESVVNFFRNKLSPNTSYAVDAFFGGRYGKDFDPSDIYKIYPMYTDDFVKAWKEEGGLLATSTVLVPNIVGIGYGSYASKGQIDATLEDLQKRNMRSDEMDKEKIHNYNDGGRPITIKEFEEFAKKRDEEIGKDLKLLFENGINGVPYKDLTPEQVQDETSYIKATATRQVKEEMFGKQKMTRQEKKERKKLSKQRIEKYKNN